MNTQKAILYLDNAIFACLCLFIFCLPFAKAGIETFTWLAIFLFILKRALGYRSESFWHLLPRTGLNTVLAIFLAVNILSMIFSVNAALSLRGLLGKQLKFMVIFFMVAETVNSKKRLKYVLTAVIASLLLVLIDVSVQYIRGYDFLRGYKGFSRKFPALPMNASFGFSSDFAGWLIIIVPLCFGILFTRGLFNRLVKILLSALALFFLICLILTFSRGAWVGIMLALPLMAYYLIKYSKKEMKILIPCSILCAIVLFLVLPQQIKDKGKRLIKNNVKQSELVIDRIKSIPQINKGSNFERIRLWEEALNIIKDYPLFGCGPNTYSIVARNYKIAGGGGIYPHNSFLQMSAETGLIGLFAFLFVLFVFFKISLSYLNKNKNPLILGLASGILAFLVQSFFDTNLYALQLVVLFWFFLGLSIAIIKIDKGCSNISGSKC